jgi:hypothetical protein
MTYLFLTVATLLIVASIKALDLVPRVQRVMSDTRAAVVVMAAKNMSDEQKEAAVQAAAIRMLAAFCKIAFVLAAASAAALAAVFLGIGLDLYTAEDAARASLNPVFLVSSCVLLFGVFKIMP